GDDDPRRLAFWTRLQLEVGRQVLAVAHVNRRQIFSQGADLHTRREAPDRVLVDGFDGAGALHLRTSAAVGADGGAIGVVTGHPMNHTFHRFGGVPRLD